MDTLVLTPPYTRAAAHRKTDKIVTVGALLVNEKGQLLVMEPSDPKFAGMTGIPRGKIHAHESIRDGLVREIYEETGLHISAPKSLLTVQADTHEHRTFIAQVNGSRVKLSKEHIGFRWIGSLDEWTEKKEPLVEDLLKGKRPEIEAFVKRVVRKDRLNHEHKF